MFKTILANMTTALAEKDGTTPDQVREVMARSVLDTLRNPSQPVLYAGAAAIQKRVDAIVSYEDAQAVLVAMIEEAGRN